MKVKIKDVKRIVYSGGGGGKGPQPPEIERPTNIEGISDEEEKKKKGTPMPGEEDSDKDQKESEDEKQKQKGEKSEEKINEKDFEEKPAEGEGEDDKDKETGEKDKNKDKNKDEEGGDEGEDSGDSGDSGDGDGDGDSGDSGDSGSKGLSKEEAKEILKKIQEEMGEIDKHIEDPSEMPTNIVEAPEGDEEGDSFKPNDPDKVNEDQTNTIIQQGKEIQQRAEEKQSGRGSGGGGYSSLGADDVKVTTNWQQSLRDFFQEHIKHVYTYMRPDRRLIQQGIVMRTKRQEIEERLDLVIAVDTSGSISRPLFNTFISEIISIIDTFDKLKFKLLLFHDNVYGEVDVNIDPNRGYNFDEETPQGTEGIDFRSITDKEDAKNEFRHLFLYQSGGTNLSSIKEHLDKRGIEAIDGLLVFTDGDTESNPTLPRYNNILFMINKGGNTSIVSKFGPVEIVDIPHSSR